MFVGRRILIVGGGLAGSRTCEALRAEGFDGDIELLCGENTPPYDRPPLSKAALTERRDTTFDIDYDALGVDLRLGVQATGLDRHRRVVLTDTGEHPYDALVVATGASPVRLPGPGRQHVLRTADDADALRAALRPGTRLTLIGAGWINAETATTARALGCSVTVLESAPAPLHQPLGPEVAQRMLPWWEHIDIRCGTSVAEVTDTGPVLADGSLVESDLVVTGIGVRPDVAWLADSGLHIDRGVVVDERLRTADPAVFAVGDVAARWSPRYRRRIVGQHWDDARTAPAVLAATLLRPDRGLVFDPVPYFWSDQFGHKIQFVGHRDPSDRMILRQGRDGRWGAAWVDDTSRLTAHLSIDSPRHMVQARMAIDRSAVVEPDAIGDLDAPVHPMPLQPS